MSPRAVALVAARDEAGRVGACVAALRPLVDDVVVVDDGSADDTADEARRSGATVIRTGRHVGKGGAVEGALRRLPDADRWLLVDADLAETAANLDAVLHVIASDLADLAIATFPPATAGGFGLVKRAAGQGIRALSGFEAREPLSGQRALTAEALAAVRPLASGFGMETAMTIDAVRAGLRVLEVPVHGLAHRSTFRDIPGFAHRGRQGLDILQALARRMMAG